LNMEKDTWKNITDCSDWLPQGSRVGREGQMGLICEITYND
jgi:hypothetical protein